METIQLSEALVEAAPAGSSGKREVELTIIKSGWGNSRNGHYYPPETLERAARDKVFDGVRMFADHLSEGQKRLLGHLPRSVRDLTGRITDTWYDAPSRTLKGRAKLVPWFYDLVSSDPNLVEASINAGGKAEARTIEGKKGRYVEAILAAASVDWVSHGGAGGKIDSLLEAHMEEAQTMLEDLTVDALVEGKPTLIKDILDGPLNERAADAEARVGTLEAEIEKMKESEVEGDKPDDTKDDTTDDAVVDAPTGEGEQPEAITEAKVLDIVATALKADREAQAADADFDKRVDAFVESDDHKALTAGAKADIASEFYGRREDFGSYEDLEEAIKARCTKRIEQFTEALAARKGVTGLGPSINTEALQEGGDHGRATRRSGSVNDLIDDRMEIREPAESTA